MGKVESHLKHCLLHFEKSTDRSHDTINVEVAVDTGVGIGTPILVSSKKLRSAMVAEFNLDTSLTSKKVPGDKAKMATVLVESIMSNVKSTNSTIAV